MDFISCGQYDKYDKGEDNVGDIASEQIQQLFNYVSHLEKVLKQIRKEAEASDEGLIVELVNIGLYSFAKKNTFKIIAVALSVVIAMIVDTSIYVLVSQVGLIPNNELIILLINRFVVNIVITAIIIILFMLFTIQKKKNKKLKNQ